MTEPTVQLEVDDGKLREYAWSYFELHAEQRLKTLQFYITLATAILGAFILLIRYGQTHKWMALLGVVLVTLSFVFAKLDRRTRELVTNGEEALKFLDSRLGLPDVEGKPHPLRIFARDDFDTAGAHLWPLSSGHFTYTRCFRWVFILFASLGLFSGLWALFAFPG